MKKFITLALALILTLSMVVAASAVTLNAAGDQAVEVQGQYVVDEADDTISVDVSWTNATWTYTVKNTWDATNHVEVAGAGVWTNDAGEEALTTITVKNNSNVGINITYEAEAVTGATATLSADNGSIEAATPENGGLTNSVTLDIDGQIAAQEEDFIAATVTITIAKAE